MVGSGHRITRCGLGVAAIVGLLTACQPGATRPFAGNGTSGSSGDAGRATAAMLNDPEGLVAIPGGGFYVADSGACVIRKIDGSGVISTVAGTGTCGNTGDGGAATAAEIQPFGGPALDAAGDLYFIQMLGGNPFLDKRELRIVAPNGTISAPTAPHDQTISGLTSAPNGTVYYDDSWVSVGTPGTIHAIATDGTVSTVFTTTTSVLTSLVYLGPGSFATVDLDNSVARLSEVLERIDVAAGTITPVPGLSASVTFQLGATADGTIYATTLGNTVVRVDPDDTVTTIAGTGTADPGTTAQSGVGTDLDLSPTALATTPHNGLLIASGHVVYRLQDPAHAG